MKTNLKLVGLILIVLIVNAGIIGCTSQQIADTLAVAQAALTSTAAILAPVNPGLAKALNAGGPILTAAYDTYEGYISASAADKATALGRVQVAISAAQKNLSGLLSQAPPESRQYVTAYVAVANVVLTLIVNKLPKKTAPQSLIFAPALPLPPPNVKDAKQLKEWFNQQLSAAGHPEHSIR